MAQSEEKTKRLKEGKVNKNEWYIGNILTSLIVVPIAFGFILLCRIFCFRCYEKCGHLTCTRLNFIIRLFTFLIKGVIMPGIVKCYNALKFLRRILKNDL